MIIGRLICDGCGKDCTDLYGFALMVRGTVRNQRQQEALAEVKKQFGKEEFVWCWSCTAKAFGVMPKIAGEPQIEPKQESTLKKTATF